MNGTLERIALKELPVAEPLRVAVIVASLNRPQEVGELLRALKNQTLLPSVVILSVTKPEDAPLIDDDSVTLVFGDRGLTRQRNRGLDAARGLADVAVFFDDDFLPAANALAGVAEIFKQHGDVVGATGLVLRDGIKTGGLSYADSIDCLDNFMREGAHAPLRMVDFDELYGCNMAVRLSAAEDLRFDERLPLYAWQEDVDFAGQLLKKGRVVRTNWFAGVHRGVTYGRNPGILLGISQIINPVYLARKGTMPPLKAARLIARNILANHAKALRPESYVDRIGRMRGNWLGFWFLLIGRIDPEVILKLRQPARFDRSMRRA
jgi:GT2 family glycosyltransferase